MQNIIIHPELEQLLPPLSEQEFLGLESDILVRGCLTPIVLWNDYLLDDHHRYRICQKHNLEFQTRVLEFESLDDARLWAWSHQEHRRNLTTFQRAEIALRFKPILAAKGKQNMAAGGKGCQNSDNLVSEILDVKTELAQMAGISHDTIHRVEFLLNNADEETKERLRQGETSINKEYRQLQEQKNSSLSVEKKSPPDPEFLKKLAEKSRQISAEVIEKDYEYQLEVLPSKNQYIIDLKNMTTETYEYHDPEFMEGWVPPARTEAEIAEDEEWLRKLLVHVIEKEVRMDFATREGMRRAEEEEAAELAREAELDRKDALAQKRAERQERKEAEMASRKIGSVKQPRTYEEEEKALADERNVPKFNLTSVTAKNPEYFANAILNIMGSEYVDKLVRHLMRLCREEAEQEKNF